MAEVFIILHEKGARGVLTLVNAMEGHFYFSDTIGLCASEVT